MVRRRGNETRRWAGGLLTGRQIDDLDGGIDDDRVKSLTRGPEPLQERFDTREEQAAHIIGYLKSLQDHGEPLRSVCVVARTQRERDALAEAVQRADLPLFRLQADSLDDAATEGVRFATMHRVKGLEFDRVVLASVNANLIPLPNAVENTGDGVEREAAETAERALVHVAATRAKKELLVLSFGTPSPFLRAPGSRSD